MLLSSLLHPRCTFNIHCFYASTIAITKRRITIAVLLLFIYILIFVLISKVVNRPAVKLQRIFCWCRRRCSTSKKWEIYEINKCITFCCAFLVNLCKCIHVSCLLCATTEVVYRTCNNLIRFIIYFSNTLTTCSTDTSSSESTPILAAFNVSRTSTLIASLKNPSS